MGNMKQGGVSVGVMSHKCGKKKGRVHMKSVRVVTQIAGEIIPCNMPSAIEFLLFHIAIAGNSFVIIRMTLLSWFQ